MPQHKSAERRVRLSEKKKDQNKAEKTKMRNLIKRVREAETPEEGAKAYRETTAVLDKLATKGVIHKNLAANKKSRLSKFVKSIGK